MNTLTKLAIGLFLGVFLQQYALAGAAADAFSRKDYNEAYRQWSKTPNTSEAKFGIGRILLEGLGGPKDSDKGLASIRDAASTGYRPAVEYLAVYFQKSGALNSAIPYLKRLQATSKTLKRQEEIVRILGNVTRRPHSQNRVFCEELKILSELGGSADMSTARDCALNGLPSAMTKAQAESELKSTLVSSPSFKSLERLAPDALNPASDGFDPTSLLDALIKVDPTLSSNDSKRLLSLGGVSKDICVSLPSSNANQKSNQLSYCALAALTGDRQLAITSANAFSSGEFGRKSADLAIKFAQLAGSPPELNGLQLQMFAEDQSKWKEHLDFLSATAQTLSQDEINVGMRFQSDIAGRSGSGYTRAEYAQLLNVAVNVNIKNLDLELLDRLIEAKNVLPVPSSFAILGGEPKDLESNLEILKKRFSGEQGIRFKLTKAKGNEDIRAFLPLVVELIALNPTLEQVERIKLLDDSLNLIERKKTTLLGSDAIILGNLFNDINANGAFETDQKAYRIAALVRKKIDESRTLAATNNPELLVELNTLNQKLTNFIVAPRSNVVETNSNQGPSVISNEPKTQVSEPLSVFDERKLVCNRTNLPNECRDVGLILTKRLQSEPFGFHTNGLLNEALTYLGKAVAAGDLVAHRYIVDAYEMKPLLTGDDKKQSDRSLQALIAKGDIGGELRRHLKIINTNPLNQVVTNLSSIFSGGNRFADACSKVKAIFQRNRLDDYDRGLAVAALESKTCKP